jgi:hypothetical protein
MDPAPAGGNRQVPGSGIEMETAWRRNQEIHQYRYLLDLDSELAGSAYGALIKGIYEKGAENSDDAWAQRPMSSGSDMAKVRTYDVCQGRGL